MRVDIGEFLKGIKHIQMKGRWGSKNSTVSDDVTCYPNGDNVYFVSANRANSVCCAYQIPSVTTPPEEAFSFNVAESISMIKAFSGIVNLSYSNGILQITDDNNNCSIPLLANHESSAVIDKFAPPLIQWIEDGFEEEFGYGSVGKYDHALTVGIPALTNALKACDTTGYSNYTFKCEDNSLEVSSSIRNKSMNRRLETESQGNAATVVISSPVATLFQNDETIEMRVHDDSPLFARSNSAAILVAPHIER